MRELKQLLLSVVVCGMCYSSNVTGQPAGALKFSIDEAVQYAYQNSNFATDARIAASLTRNQAYQVVPQGLPKVDAKVEYSNYFKLPVSLIPGEFVGEPGRNIELQFGEQHNADISIQATQLIIDGRYFIGLRALDAIRETSELENELSLLELKELIVKAYYSALVSEQSSRILKKNLRTTEDILRETKALYESGFAEEIDVDRLSLAKANIETSIQNLEKLEVNAFNNLKFYMGLPLAQEISLTDSLDRMIKTTSLNVFDKADPNKRTEFRLLQKQLELREYDIKQKRAGYFPTLDGFFSYGTNAQRSQFDLFGDGRWFQNGLFGLSLNVPIFDGLTKDASIQESKLKVELSKNDIETFEKSMELEAAVSSTELSDALNRYQDQEENLALAQKIYDKSVIMFREGVGSSLDLSRAESDLIDTQINYINALYSVLVAKTDLEIALGNF